MPSCLSYLGGGRVFIGSSHGDQIIISLVKQRQTDGNFFTLTTLEYSIAPLLDACLLDNNSANLSLLACANAHGQGSLIRCQQGLDLECEAESEFPAIGIEAAFALSDHELIVTGLFGSLKASSHGEDVKIETLPSKVFWANDRLTVTPHEFYFDKNRVAFGSIVSLATANGEWMAVCMADGQVCLYRGTELYQKIPMDVNVTTMCLNERGQLFVAGWCSDGMSSAVYNADGDVLGTYAGIIRSMACVGDSIWLGFHSGDVELMGGGERIKLGNRPVSCLFTANDACFGLSDTLCQIGQQRVAAWIQHELVDAVAPLSDGRLVMFGGGKMRIVKPMPLNGVGELHIRRTPLHQTVRRLCRLQNSLVACLGTDRLFLLDDLDALLNEYCFGEEVQLASLAAIQHRGMDLIVVGASDMKSYLYTFACEDGRLRLMGKFETPGLVYALLPYSSDSDNLIGSMEGSVGMWCMREGEWSLVDRYHVGVLGVQLTRRDNLVLIGDMLRSCSLLAWEQNKWKGVAHSYSSDWITSVAMGSRMLAADSLGNLFSLSLQDNRITTEGVFHLGQVVNCIQHTGPRGIFTDSWIYLTTLGTIGMIGALEPDDFQTLQSLERKIVNSIPWPGQFDHTKWRSLHTTDTRQMSHEMFIDGLHVERMLGEEDIIQRIMNSK